jgi:Fe-S-cluster-containing dehydrogenase component
MVPVTLTDIKAISTTSELQTRSWVMVVDLARCNGCKACTESCIEEHYVPPAWGEPNYKGYQEWIKVYEMASPGGGKYFFPRPCMHCDNAPCVKVCPVGASYKRDDGLVLINQDRCIGCRFCIAACPYEARYFNWYDPPVSPEEKFVKYSDEYPVPHRRGVVEKCVFCAHRTDMGRLPACVEACHNVGMNALYFGDAKEDAVSNGAEVVRLSELLSKNNAYRFKEELGTQPRVYYLAPR